ncbi:IclR family transcriptional regulator C-terminal domain-containing protein [Streptomyces sp. CL12-4]|uniref:IclR family transcriptional regulator C-terminal domain-containing protein n=1 Tax=Streptomyces sp. CL12-4 TaxID=2810306 RepID=UPI001EFB267F|nr:IclR family transcriptional regulator C-terminal domain-containing protein [Streptomyces sp. CL12-4]
MRRTTGAEAYFTAYRDGSIAVIDTTEPLTDRGSPWPLGLETKAHATAHGKVLLASLPRATRRLYLAAHGMARLTERTIIGARGGQDTAPGPARRERRVPRAGLRPVAGGEPVGGVSR